jgi:electron transfer flavoprotein beta subunit
LSGYHIVVCGGIVPDPLQRLEPVMKNGVPELKNEMMLPAVLDPWAASALYEAAQLAKSATGSRVWLVCAGPKAKLQQVMMVIAQKVSFELVAVDAPASGFADASAVAAVLADAISKIPGLDRSRLLLFGGWESASRGSGTTLQMIGERLELVDQFQGVDKIAIQSDGSIEVLERLEGGKHQVSVCSGPPAVFGWATGELAEPPNNPQVGMTNMRTVMPALQRAVAAPSLMGDLAFAAVSLPAERRETRVVKDLSVDQIAQEIAQWIKGN